MRRTLYCILLIGALLLARPYQAAFAAERVVRMTVPGCASWGAAERIGSILKKIESIKKFEIGDDEIVTVTFDDEKVKIEEIVKLLDWGHFPVKGAPEFLN